MVTSVFRLIRIEAMFRASPSSSPGSSLSPQKIAAGNREETPGQGLVIDEKSDKTRYHQGYSQCDKRPQHDAGKSLGVYELAGHD